MTSVEKNPTPALAMPCDGERFSHDEVSKPGRCQPSRSAKKPPSLVIPRALSGKLEGEKVQRAPKPGQQSTDSTLPPSLPCTFHDLNSPPPTRE